MAASEREVTTDHTLDQESSRPPQEKKDNIYVEYLQKILDEIRNNVVK